MVEAKDDSLKASSLTLMITIGVIIVATIGMIILLFRFIVMQRMNKLEESLRDIAEGDGDLRKRIEVRGNDCIDRLGTYFNAFVDKIHKAITRVNDATMQLSAASEQMPSVTDQTTDAIVEQQSETEQVATAIDEMAATVQKVARNASEAAAAAGAYAGTTDSGINNRNSEND